MQSAAIVRSDTLISCERFSERYTLAIANAWGGYRPISVRQRATWHSVGSAESSAANNPPIEQSPYSVQISTDGRDHRRRAPETYDRILKHIGGYTVVVHCTLARQMVSREGYLRDFAAFWTDRPEVRKIWFSIFTPPT